MITWELITECLRTELQEYGALLALFDEQQAALLRRDPARVAELADTIERQAAATQTIRTRREKCVQAFALQNGDPADTTLRDLQPHFPAEVRPLIHAFIGELNHLVRRIRRDARHNHLLLSRTVQAHEEIFRTLLPGTFSAPTYTPGGALAGASSSRSAWQAAG